MAQTLGGIAYSCSRGGTQGRPNGIELAAWCCCRQAPDSNPASTPVSGALLPRVGAGRAQLGTARPCLQAAAQECNPRACSWVAPWGVLRNLSAVQVTVVRCAPAQLCPGAPPPPALAGCRVGRAPVRCHTACRLHPYHCRTVRRLLPCEPDSLAGSRTARMKRAPEQYRYASSRRLLIVAVVGLVVGQGAVGPIRSNLFQGTFLRLW